MIKLWAAWFRVWVLARGRRYFYFPKYKRPIQGPTQSPIQWAAGVPTPVVKWLRCEGDYPPPPTNKLRMSATTDLLSPHTTLPSYLLLMPTMFQTNAHLTDSLIHTTIQYLQKQFHNPSTWINGTITQYLPTRWQGVITHTTTWIWKTSDVNWNFNQLTYLSIFFAFLWIPWSKCKSSNFTISLPCC